MQRMKWALYLMAALMLMGIATPSRAQVSFGVRRVGLTFNAMAVASNNNGETVVGGDKGELALYNFQTKKLRKLVTNLNRPVSEVEFSKSDDVFLLSAGNFVQLWIRNGTRWHVKRQLEFLYDVCSLAFSPDGKRFAVGLEQNGSIEVYDTKKVQLKLSIGRSATSTKLVFLDSLYLLELTAEGSVRVYDSKTAALKKFWQAHPLNGYTVALRGGILATSGDYMLPVPVPTDSKQKSEQVSELPDVINLWDAKTGKAAGTIKMLTTALDLAYSSTGSTLVAGCKDGFVRFYDPATRNEVSAYTDGSKHSVVSVSLPKKGKVRLAIANRNLWIEILTIQRISVPGPL